MLALAVRWTGQMFAHGVALALHTLVREGAILRSKYPEISHLIGS
jgi:hypothetical protein